ncbi:TPA: hypothetical protein NJ279_004510 [Vibrio parahaemolyticus]|uniref:hypothetical protein n=1 Tax=Vibrio parahaemolyticus TaxID=670 RepID=UPI000812CF3A|nr:hypothetical protein [Vibrio parahaemolyticus]AYF20131.1 hypothetical protein FORC71_1759 [Vibrio parahaemolyticus]EGQ9460408.1 hypothetical protein [Vibrio parahaemolyticus]EJE4692120.1 hypothetical protein [Vibrio parahaemolyticus]EJK2426524.1 hypothetical protein [Vibrio parahaemolyticus]MCZ6362978.1 hypothetical protein [Vibrio parahaemolyticus]
MTDKSIWWEKTVEYKFVVDAAKCEERNLDFAAPLSGIQEMAADGVFSADAKLILVEFKRDLKSLKTEADKFTCYKKAAKKMKGRDRHHFLVYGYISRENQLELEARRYFSLNKKYPPLSILDEGLVDSEFKEYLRDLIKLKKVDKRSSGTVAPEFLNSVMGVSPQGASSISLSEYVRIKLPELYQALIKTNEPDGPGLKK